MPRLLNRTCHKKQEPDLNWIRVKYSPHCIHTLKGLTLKKKKNLVHSITITYNTLLRVHQNFSLLYIPKVELYSQNKISYQNQLVSQNPLISYSLIRGKGGKKHNLKANKENFLSLPLQICSGQGRYFMWSVKWFLGVNTDKRCCIMSDVLV